MFYRVLTLDSKVAVVIDAFLENALLVTPYPEGLSAIETITRQIASLVQALSGEYGRILAQIIAEGQADPEALDNYRNHFVNHRRAEVKAIIQQGIEHGELTPSLDPELAIDILYGPIYYRLLVGHLPLDPLFAEELPQWAMKALKIT